MEKLSSLYQQFQKSVAFDSIKDVERFDQESFWELLSTSEREELAHLFLSRAENESDEEALLNWVCSAEKLSSESAILCSSALTLFHYATVHGKGRYLLLALDKVNLAAEENPTDFEAQGEWWHLWGNILVALGRFVQDETFIERALEKYKKAASLIESEDLNWDWGEAWIILGQHSKEVCDLQRGIEIFSQLDHDSPYFNIDYGEALTLFAQLRGDPKLLEEALKQFQKAIAKAYPDEPRAYEKGWTAYVKGAILRYKLTHTREDFDAADKIVHEAIVSIPHAASLWLDWGELYLHSGWLQRDLKEVETALDKLTSSKIKECDPLDLSALLGQGLLFLGLYFEDFKLLQEGRERILAALEIAPEHPELIYGAGLAHFGFAIYFSDLNAFAEAVAMFKKGLELDATAWKNWHGLFRAYIGWGSMCQDPSIIRKGIKAIARLTSLFPYSSLYLNEWGVALLRSKQVEQIDEAIVIFKRAWRLYEEPETLYNLGCAFDLLGDITGDEEDYERAIEALDKVYHSVSGGVHVQYRLALALSHYGELTTDVESLYRSVELFRLAVQAVPEDETYLCQYGYALLNLAELVHDPIRPTEEESLHREAEKVLLQAAGLGNGDACYHLACLYSITKLFDASMLFLNRAEKAYALPFLSDLEHDEWLANLRETEAFQEFLLTRKENGR